MSLLKLCVKSVNLDPATFGILEQYLKNKEMLGVEIDYDEGDIIIEPEREYTLDELVQWLGKAQLAISHVRDIAKEATESIVKYQMS